ncbi:MAG: hypothetical protein ACNA8W_01340 [Bradymonadaceae bacterium]
MPSSTLIVSVIIALIFMLGTSGCLSDPAGVQQGGEDDLPTTTESARSGEGLLAYYPFRNRIEEETSTPDESGRELATAMELSENVDWLGSRGVKVLGGGALTFELGQGLERIRQREGLSFELWLRPATTGGAPQPFCTLGGRDAPSLTLVREGLDLLITAAGATPLRLENILPRNPHHLTFQLVITYADGVGRLYLDGLLATSWVSTWDLSGWRNGRLTCTSGVFEADNEAPRELELGEVSLIALYDRALRPIEVWSHFDIGDHPRQDDEGFSIAAELHLEHVGRGGPTRPHGEGIVAAHISGVEGQEATSYSIMEIGERRVSFVRWDYNPSIEPYVRGFILVHSDGSSNGEPMTVSVARPLHDWVAGEMNWLGPRLGVVWDKPGAAEPGKDHSPWLGEFTIQFPGLHRMPISSSLEDFTQGQDGQYGLVFFGDISRTRLETGGVQWYRSPQLLFIRSHPPLQDAPKRPQITRVESRSGDLYLDWIAEEGDLFEIYRNGILLATTVEPSHVDGRANVRNSYDYSVVACSLHYRCSPPSTNYSYTP